MSRIGKQPIAVPEKVTVSIKEKNVQVKGPKGELKYTLPSDINFEQKEKNIYLTPANQQTKTSSLWGLARTLIANMIKGVDQGFEKSLEFTGVGYKAAVAGNVLTLNLGYSHKIDYTFPTGISGKVMQNTIVLAGSDKELLGHVAAKIRAFRPPEPYKGKGIKYSTETIIRKAGKTGAAKKS
ncbi:MAG: 50S ribosomal protein L6 [Bacteriovoracaceae bacterium]|nr:50S ribosomal protein L6 [Bacteriovoracaceae bacterium]